MNSAIIVCVLAVVALAVARPEQKYTNRYDNVNLDEILGNKKLLTAYVKCILDQGRCTPEGKELKSHVREALEQDCEKCTPAQRNGSEQVIAHLVKHEPNTWTELKAKYDPTGKFSRKYEANLRSIQA